LLLLLWLLKATNRGGAAAVEAEAASIADANGGAGALINGRRDDVAA
jgi:hypothetical protein